MYLDILNYFLGKFKLNNIELLKLDDEYYKFNKKFYENIFK